MFSKNASACNENYRSVQKIFITSGHGNLEDDVCVVYFFNNDFKLRILSLDPLI